MKVLSDVKGLTSDEGEGEVLRRVAAKFKIGVPNWALNASAAVRRQYLPSAEELRTTPAERADPIGDDPHQKCEGLIHRYPDRALLMPTHSCAVYCRFCFRRSKVGKTAALSERRLAAAFAYLERHRRIREVILSGGDPLLLPASGLEKIFHRLKRIKHIRLLRIHTRIPVAVPRALSPMKLRAIDAVGLPVYAVIHCNHAAELHAETLTAIAALKRVCAGVLAQTVLLKGVNDDADTLEALLRRLVENGVLPYYLHHPDLAEGTSHFRVGIARGRALMAELTRRLSGLCRPQYVLDIPGGFGKVPISPQYINRNKNGWWLTDCRGGTHFYSED